MSAYRPLLERPTIACNEEGTQSHRELDATEARVLYREAAEIDIITSCFIHGYPLLLSSVSVVPVQDLAGAECGNSASHTERQVGQT